MQHDPDTFSEGGTITTAGKATTPWDENKYFQI